MCLPHSYILLCCAVLVLQANTHAAAFVDSTTTTTSSQRQLQQYTESIYTTRRPGNNDSNRLKRRRPRTSRHTDNVFSRPSWMPLSISSVAVGTVLAVRGGGSSEDASNTTRDVDGNRGRAGDYMQSPSPASDKPTDTMEKIATDFKAKRDDIAADVRARGEAFAADLKAKQEKITDEVLRDRGAEAFGELGGHRSYDSATAGLDVANRRSFFLGIRRVVLLVQVVELIAACVWQAVFPYGGVAGFIVIAKEPLSTRTGEMAGNQMGEGWPGQGRLGLAMSAALGQSALYTMLLVFFGCDRVVLRATRLTGYEHWAAAAWALVRAVRVAEKTAKLSHLVVSLWLASMAFICGYFGRQL